MPRLDAEIVGAHEQAIDTFDRGDLFGVLDPLRAFDHDDDQVGGVERRHQRRRVRRLEIDVRKAAEQCAAAARRIAQRLHGGTRFFGALDMRHHHAKGAVVEQARGERMVAARHAHQRCDARIEAGDRKCGGGLNRHGAVLEVEKQPVEARCPHRLGDFDRARDPDAEPERHLAVLQPPPCRILDRVHRHVADVLRGVITAASA